MSQIMEDSTVSIFLDFFDKDIEDHPDRLIPISTDLQRRATALVNGVDIGDINEKLPEDE